MANMDKDEAVVNETPEAELPEAEAAAPLLDAVEKLKTALTEQEDKYLRLAAEYDNFRKRSQRERGSAWADAQADTLLAFLPVYDNLERAMKQETVDEAYAKGVEMTMTQFKAVLEKLGIQEIPAVGEPFDPALHNAIVHIEDESLGKNIITECFQTGFKLGDKVIRFALVKVAN